MSIACPNYTRENSLDPCIRPFNLGFKIFHLSGNKRAQTTVVDSGSLLVPRSNLES